MWCMETVAVLSMDQVLELVNHYARPARRAAENEDHGYLPLAEVLETGLADPGVESLHEIAEGAYDVFARAHDGEDVADALNSLLGAARPTPLLGAGGSVEWQVGRREQALRASVAVSLLDWVHTRGADRLGLCHGLQCADAFADLSAAGRRKYCSPGCLNRHKVAAFRRRAAERTTTT